jgi:hypothetical protein
LKDELIGTGLRNQINLGKREQREVKKKKKKKRKVKKKKKT